MIGYHIKMCENPAGFLLQNEFLLASKEEIRDKYTLPNAFSAFTAKWK
jgi:hypothetical protein